MGFLKNIDSVMLKIKNSAWKCVYKYLISGKMMDFKSSYRAFALA